MDSELISRSRVVNPLKRIKENTHLGYTTGIEFLQSASFDHGTRISVSEGFLPRCQILAGKDCGEYNELHD